MREGGELAHRHGAEAQVHRQVRRTLDRRVVARFAVVVDALREVAHERSRAGHARPDAERGEVRRAETHRRERRDAAVELGRRRGEPARRARVVDAGQARGRQRREPGALVRREHRERRAGLRQDLAPLEDHLVARRAPVDAQVRERVRDRRVAIERGGLVVVVRVHRAHAEFARERRNRVARARVADDQAAAALAQRGVQFGDARVDELDAAVLGGGKRVEDLAVEDERAVDRTAFRERGGQRRMVAVPQVAAEPDEGGGSVGHGGDGQGPGARLAEAPTRGAADGLDRTSDCARRAGTITMRHSWVRP